MISGLDDPRFGAGAPLGELAAAADRRLAFLTGHWRHSAPSSVAACARTLLQRGHDGDTPARAFLVPGRIEVLGKHTDYAGGRSLLAAVERGFCFLAVARPDAVIHVSALDLKADCRFPVSPDLVPSGGWANYPMTVARRLARDFPGRVPGAEIAVGGDLPPAAGMSSSSALIVGTFLSLAGTGRLLQDPCFRREVRDPHALASYLASVESGQGFGSLPGDRGVGTHGGSEDHAAILLARENALLQYGFTPATLERVVRMPPGYRFAIAASGIEAEKTGAARESYNRASALARSLRDLWSHSGAVSAVSLADALRSSPDAPDRLRAIAASAEAAGYPPADLVARLDHFLRESEEIVPAAADALAAGRVERFGALVDESQRLAETRLGNQIAETIELARSARRLGAAAASAFGAGYGGSVWALVEESALEDFVGRWRRGYEAAFPEAAGRALFFGSAAGPAARRVL